MAIMIDSGLAASISDWLISFATEKTLAFWTFISAGIVNMFVPSGGGQWAVQSAVEIASAEALGVDIPGVAMAVAWGDAWTYLLQSLCALSLLSIAWLKAKDIMGYCLMQLVVSGVVIGIVLTYL